MPALWESHKVWTFLHYWHKHSAARIANGEIKSKQSFLARKLCKTSSSRKDQLTCMVSMFIIKPQAITLKTVSKYFNTLNVSERKKSKSTLIPPETNCTAFYLWIRISCFYKTENLDFKRNHLEMIYLLGWSSIKMTVRKEMKKLAASNDMDIATEKQQS